MKHKSFLLITGLLILLFSARGYAAFYINNVNDTVTGGEMAGLFVEAVFFDPATSTTSSSIAYWFAPPLSDSGWAMGLGYTLYQAGDTLYNQWSLTNFSADLYLQSLFLKGLETRYQQGEPLIVFDIRSSGPYTEGSQWGILTLPTGASHDTTGYEVYYKSVITEDLYAGITITFEGNGIAPGSDPVTFYLDTDKVSLVPIPGAYLLLGSGLLCLIGIKRRTR